MKYVNKMVWMISMVLVALVSTTGCYGDGGMGNQGAAGTAGSGCNGSCDDVCDAGMSRGCPCSDGRDGSQTCKDDGSGWNACMCTGPMPGSGGSSGKGGTGGTGGGGECVSGQLAACDGCPSGFTGAKKCGSDNRWGSCSCVSNGTGGTGGSGGSSGTGGSSASGGTGGSSAGSSGTGGGNRSDWVWVEFVYTLPANAPDILMARAFGWVPGYSGGDPEPLDSDFCNSQNAAPGSNVFVRSGNTFRCTVRLPPNWKQGQYNVELNSVNGAVSFPSHKQEQHFCGELMGNEIPAGCGTPCYVPYGTLWAGGVDLNGAECRQWNSETGGGCNVFPNACE